MMRKASLLLVAFFLAGSAIFLLWSPGISLASEYQPGPWIVGSLQDTQNQPIAGARVYLSDSEQDIDSHTDEQANTEGDSQSAEAKTQADGALPQPDALGLGSEFIIAAFRRIGPIRGD